MTRQVFLFLAAILVTNGARADIIYTKAQTLTGEVIRVSASGVVIKFGANETQFTLSEIISIDKPKPPALDTAATQIRARQFNEAIQTLKPIVVTFGGLKVPWARDAFLMLGDAYAAIPNAIDARKVYDQFKTLYPANATLVEVKYARILVEQKQYGQAIAPLTAFLEPLLKKTSVTDDEEQAAAEGLLLLGDCQRATGKLDLALDNYLTVMTLFDVDNFITAQARYDAAQTFEELKKWGRAKDTYKQLLAKAPPAEIAGDAKKRLDALVQAHPE